MRLSDLREFDTQHPGAVIEVELYNKRGTITGWLDFFDTLLPDAGPKYPMNFPFCRIGKIIQGGDTFHTVRIGDIRHINILAEAKKRRV